MTRVAIYYAPIPNDPLWPAANTWLGRDPETAAPVPQPPIPGIAEATAESRLYGFHATLKPPMRLLTSYDAFLADAQRLAATLTPFDLPRLAGRRPAGASSPCAKPRPAPPSTPSPTPASRRWTPTARPADDAELARRRRHGLPPAQDAMLVRWGYPHVFETWFFHMTLTRRLSPEAQAVFRPAAETWFAPALALPRRVDALTVFTQAAPGAPFLVAERLAFGGTAG